MPRPERLTRRMVLRIDPRTLSYFGDLARHWGPYQPLTLAAVAQVALERCARAKGELVAYDLPKGKKTALLALTIHSESEPHLRALRQAWRVHSEGAVVRRAVTACHSAMVVERAEALEPPRPLRDAR